MKDLEVKVICVGGRAMMKFSLPIVWGDADAVSRIEGVLRHLFGNDVFTDRIQLAIGGGVYSREVSFPGYIHRRYCLGFIVECANLYALESTHPEHAWTEILSANFGGHN